KTSSRVMARSSSSVVTPISSAVANASRVFSGASPRAPRWPCRSNAMASPAAMMPAATIATLLILGKGASPVEHLAHALPDQAERDEEDQEIGELVEQLRRCAPGEPEAGEVGRDRERQQQGRGRERPGRELAEREIGRDLHHV